MKELFTKCETSTFDLFKMTKVFWLVFRFAKESSSISSEVAKILTGISVEFTFKVPSDNSTGLFCAKKHCVVIANIKGKF